MDVDDNDENDSEDEEQSADESQEKSLSLDYQLMDLIGQLL